MTAWEDEPMFDVPAVDVDAAAPVELDPVDEARAAVTLGGGDGAGLLRADALRIPLADNSVDLVVTSPPYFALRSYQDGDGHYDGQIGSEATPQAFLEALWAVTAECARVLKPSGSIFVNLGDKYAGSGGHNNNGLGSSTLKNDGRPKPRPDTERQRKLSESTRRNAPDRYNQDSGGVPAKSLMLLPERYRVGCVDQLGLICRATIVWSKPNGLPESVTDRVRRSHEDWVHLVKQPRYYAAVDNIREAYAPSSVARSGYVMQDGPAWAAKLARGDKVTPSTPTPYADNPLGKLPGSVWEVATEPLRVPDWVGVDHFACVDAATEILSDRGWLTHDQLEVGDTVAGYNLDTGLAEWTRCHAVHRYDYDGELVAVDKRDLSMRLTPNHRCVVQKRHGRSGHRGVDQVVTADELTANHFIPRSAEWTPFEHKSIGEPTAALLGWVTAEGHVTETGQVRLTQSLTANPEHVAEIDRLLASFVLMPSPDRAARKKYRRVLDSVQRTERVRFWKGEPYTVVEWALPLGLSQDVLALAPGKRLTMAMVGLPENERRALLDAFIDGDGHRRPDGRIGVFQKERQNLDVLQAVAVTLGYKTTLQQGADKWVLYLTTGGRSVTLRGTNGRLDPIPREHYRGVVWCPTTGTGTMLCRREGRVFITGQSFPSEWPRRLILGWSPSGVCTVCGEGRRPVVEKDRSGVDYTLAELRAVERVDATGGAISGGTKRSTLGHTTSTTITGEACACPTPDAPTRPAVVLDPFGGTGTTAMVARSLGRFGVSVDLSADYLRLARWRIWQSGHGAKAVSRTWRERQESLFDGEVA